MSTLEKDDCFNTLLESFGTKQNFYAKEWQNPDFFRRTFNNLCITRINPTSQQERIYGKYRNHISPRDGHYNPKHEPYHNTPDDDEYL